MATILNSSILNSAILDSAIIVFPLKLTHTCQDQFPTFAQKKIHSFILTQLDDCSNLEFCHPQFSQHLYKKKFTPSFSLNLMIAAILNAAMLNSDTAILDSDTLFSSVQIHSKTLSPHSDSDSN